jgi:hypothetical protein
MGRELIHGKKSIWIVETVSGRYARVSPLCRTTGELADWLVSRGYSRKAAETFIAKGLLHSAPHGPRRPGHEHQPVRPRQFARHDPGRNPPGETP